MGSITSAAGHVLQDYFSVFAGNSAVLGFFFKFQQVRGQIIWEIKNSWKSIRIFSWKIFQSCIKFECNMKASLIELAIDLRNCKFILWIKLERLS